MEYNNGSSAAPQAAPLSPVEEEHKAKASTAMVLGIVGVSIFFLPILNIAGLVVSIIALVKAKENRRFAETNGLKENGMNTTGYICGIVGVILGALSVLVTIFIVIAIIGLIAVTVSSAAPALVDVIEENVPYLEGALDSAAAAVSGLL